MKKFIIGLNAIALPLATVATVISCGTKTKEVKVVKKEANFDELKTEMQKPKFVENIFNVLKATDALDTDKVKIALMNAALAEPTQDLSYKNIIETLKLSEYTIVEIDKHKIQEFILEFDFGLPIKIYRLF
jgi:hypothetical protein